MVRENYRALGLRLDKRNPLLRYLYLKPHKGGTDGVPKERSLFVAGLPLKVGKQQQLVALFSVFGKVENCAVHPSKRSAIVVFESEARRDVVLSAAAAGQIVEYFIPETTGPTGLKEWLNEYKAQRPGNLKLQQQIDEWMINFEEEQEKQKRAREAELAEDGWTVVKRRKGGKKVSDGNVSVAAISKSKARTAKEKKGKLDGLVENFYKFQAKEKKQQAVLDLLDKFEEDKKRIAKIRAERVFSPD